MPQTTQAKQAMTEQEARGEFFKQMHQAGREVEELRSLAQRQAEEIFQLKAQNVGLRSERNTSRTEANAALRMHKDVVAMASDEHWLFKREVTLKFSQRADGSRILVIRARGKNILRLRGKITPKCNTTALFKEGLEIARVRESGRNAPRKFKSKETELRATRANVRDGKKAQNEQGRNGKEQQEVTEDAT